MRRRGVGGRGGAVVAGEATRRHRVGYVGAVRGLCPPPGRCRSGAARPRVVRCVVRSRADALLARGVRAARRVWRYYFLFSIVRGGSASQD